jgi:hypothetical protein
MSDTKDAHYIQKMISNFKTPQKDALSECILGTKGTKNPTWDSGIFISIKQSEKYYSDIYQFWVRAFFCFIEDVQKGALFKQVVPSITCNEVSSEYFEYEYHKLLQQSIKTSTFIEHQNYPDTYVEVEKRKFTSAHIILSRLDIKSAVANSDGEFVAYFITRKSLLLVN